MAKACGLRIGPRRFELFVLDGSPKSPKVVTSLAGEIPPDPDAPMEAAAHALKAAIREHKVSMDNVGVVIDARSGAFRSMTLPLTDASKIESVLRYEVESDLPQFNIEDVVVDFHVQDSTGDSSALLVTAVPKADVQSAIDLCTEAGFEPLEIELETSALVNAAPSAGLGGLEEAHVLVHVGEESTAVAVIDGGKVREMRVIQAGALSYTPYGAPPPAEADGEGEGGEFDEPVEAPEADDWASEGPQPMERTADIVSRLRRELARTVSAVRTVNDLQGVHVAGFQLPGLTGEDILGIPVEALDAFSIDDVDPAVHAEYTSGAVAYGAAVRQLGGGIVKASLRRDELKFSGALERLELPLAVLLLLVTTFLGVWYMFLDKERAAIDRDLRFVLDSSVNYMMGNPKLGKPGNLEFPPEKLAKYVESTTGRIGNSTPPEYRSDPTRNLYEQMTFIRSMLSSQQRDLQKRLGHDNELLQPQSALKGTTLVLDLMANNAKKYGRMSFRTVRADYRNSPRGGDSVSVNLELSFFAESSTKATQNYEAFFADLKEQPWFIDVKSSRSDPITGAESGIYLPSVIVDVDVSKAEQMNS